MCQNGATCEKKHKRHVALKEPQMRARAMRTDVDGVLDVADDDVDELFDKLAHFLFLQRLGVVLVQHLPHRHKMSAETFPVICVPTHAATAGLL